MTREQGSHLRAGYRDDGYLDTGEGDLASVWSDAGRRQGSGRI